MSLYNLHYLEFMATSHDKFWSHPGCRVLPGGRPPRFASPLRSGQGEAKQDEQDVQDRQDGSPLRVT